MPDSVSVRGSSAGHIQLEIAVDDARDVSVAEQAGADRLELCAALEVGGVTPGPGLLAEALAGATTPVTVLVRPRRGDFVHDPALGRALLADVRAARAAGAAGVALGALTREGRIDVPLCRAAIEAAGPMTVTFHRAFDALADPLGALEQLRDLGVARILTSGGAPRALDGAARLAELVARAGADIEVVPGGGVRAEHVADLVQRTGARAVHASASHLVPTGPAAAGSLAPSHLPAEHELRRVDAEQVSALRRGLSAG